MFASAAAAYAINTRRKRRVKLHISGFGILAGTTAAPLVGIYTAKGGGLVAPVVFTLDSGVMPTGTAMGTDGVITGTAVGTGTFPVTFKVQDAIGAKAYKNVVIVIA